LHNYLTMYNFDTLIEKNSRKYKDKDPLAPKWPFRMLITGPSGCGKTNTLLEMILTSFLHFDKIYLYAKNIQQDKYQFLIKTINQLEEKLDMPKNSMIYACAKIDDVLELPKQDEEEEKPNGIMERRKAALKEIVAIKEKKVAGKGKGKATETKKQYLTAEDASDSNLKTKPKPKNRGQELDPEKQNLVIFDDFISEKNQHIIEDYFVGSRHWNCSCIYLSQSYYDTPKMIRKNCTHFAIYRFASDREVQELAKDHAGHLGKEVFKDMYHQCVQYPYHFMLIDKVTKDSNLQYRVNFGRIPIGHKEESVELEAESESDNDELNI